MKRRLPCLLLLATATAAAAAQSTRPTTRELAFLSPKETLLALSAALTVGDESQIRQILLARTAAEEQLLDAMVEMAQALAALHRASVASFGEAAARSLPGAPADAAQREQQRMDDALQLIDRDEARIHLPPPDDEPIVLRKVDARWRIPVGEHARLSAPTEIATRAEELHMLARVVRQIAEETAAHRYDSVEEAAENLQRRLTRAAEERVAATTQPAL